MTKQTGGTIGRPKAVPQELAEAHTKPLDDKPRRPTGLGPAGRKAWEDAWNSGRVEETEAALVTEYCFLVDDVAAARKAVKALTSHYVTMGQNGAVVIHPAVTQLKDLRQALLTFQRELILSPSSRVKAGVEIEKQSDKMLEDFVKRSAARRAGE